MSKRRPLQRLLPKGSRKSYKFQSAEGKDSDWQYVAATAAEQGVQPRPHGRNPKPARDQRHNPAKQPHSHGRKASAPLLDEHIAAPSSSSPRRSLQQALLLSSSGRGGKKEEELLPMHGPETTLLDSVSRILAECADSDSEDKSLHRQIQTADLDREVLRLLHEEASSESDDNEDEDGSKTSITRIHVEHGHTPLAPSRGSLQKGGEGGKAKSNALYILYGPDQRRGGEKLPNCNTSQTSSGEGSPRLPLHPISIRSGTLEAGSDIYIDLQDGERDPTGNLSTSSSSEEEDEESNVESAHLPKPLAQELDEAQRPPSASRKSERRPGVVHPSMEEMRVLLETLADTESNFSSISSSDSGVERVGMEPGQSGMNDGSEPQQDRVAADPLLPSTSTRQQSDSQVQRESLTFEMLAMTRSEVSLTDSNSKDEEEAVIDMYRKGVRELTARMDSNPNGLTNGKITLDMLATDSGSKSSLVSTESEEGDRKLSLGAGAKRTEQEREDEQTEEVDFGQSPSQSDPLNLELTGQHLPLTDRLLVNGDDRKQDVSERREDGREDMWAFLDTEPESKGRVLPGRRDLFPREPDSHGEERAVQQWAQATVPQQEKEETGSNHPSLSSPDHSPTGSISPDLGNATPEIPARSDTIPNTSNEDSTFGLLRPEDSPSEPVNGTETEGTTVLQRLTDQPEQTATSTPEELPKASSGLQPVQPQEAVPPHHKVAVSPQEARSSPPHKPSSLGPPQVFSGLLHDHTPPQVPDRPPRRQEVATAADSHSERTHPQMPALPLPRPVPKPRKKLPTTVPTDPVPLERKEGTTSTQSETAEIQVHLRHEHTPVATGSSMPGTSDVKTAGLPPSHSLYEKIAQMEEQQRVMMEAFQREKESLWSVISQQAHVIRRMHSAGVGDRKRTKSYHKRLQRRVEAVDLGVLSIGRECASLESRLIAMETTQRGILETLSRMKVPQAAEEEMSSQASADASPRQRQRKISLLSEHKVTKLKKFFGDNPPLLELFLKRLGYEQYLPRFVTERIGLLELPHISEDQLVSLGIPMGPRLRIMNEAQLL